MAEASGKLNFNHLSILHISALVSKSSIKYGDLCCLGPGDCEAYLLVVLLELDCHIVLTIGMCKDFISNIYYAVR